MRFGVVSFALGFIALVWPLVLSLLFGNLTATLVFYAVAIVMDIALFIVWLQRALRYSKRAARGETFALEPLRRRSTRSVAAKQ